MFTQSLRALAVLGDEGEEVEGAADRGETRERKGKGVTHDIVGCVARQETEGSDGSTTATEADYKGSADVTPQVSTDC